MYKKPAVKSKKRIKPELPGGFRDYGPKDSIVRQRLIEKIRKTFEDFGFDPMETSSIERTEVLAGGEKESQKIIFNVLGSKEKSAGGKSASGGKSDTSLRFDLTVPLARFLAANSEIPKPFKRYQIGNVWRGESPQAGRYREFLQADIDIIGSSSMTADSEIINTIYQVFKNLGLNRFLIKINNRKILNCLPVYAGFPEKNLWEVLRTIDKLEKVDPTLIQKDLKKIVPQKAVQKIIEFITLAGSIKEKLTSVQRLLNGLEPADKGIQELKEIAGNLNDAGLDQQNWQIDFSIVRGLGYYTGPIFETVLTDAKEMGSICSGGRYDELMVPFTGEKIPATGASIGIDRFFAAMDERGLIKKKATTTKVIILNLSPALKKDYQEFCRILRKENINTSLYLGDDLAFQAQISYAVKREVPYVLIYGENEKKKNTITIKSMVTREQKEINKGNLAGYFNN